MIVMVINLEPRGSIIQKGLIQCGLSRNTELFSEPHTWGVLHITAIQVSYSAKVFNA